MNRSLNRLMVFSVGSAVLGLATVAFLYWIVWFPMPLNLKQQSFDQAVWAANKCQRPRQTMISDLEQTLLIPGTPRAEIEAKLGRPYQDGVDPNHVDYCLGPEPVLFPIDTEYLVVRYRTDGTLERAWQTAN